MKMVLVVVGVLLFCGCTETIWIWKGMVTDGGSGAEWMALQATGRDTCWVIDTLYDSYEVECR